MQSNRAVEKKVKALGLKLALCKDFDEVIEVASKALGNPMILYGVAYSAWAYTKNVVTDDDLWNEFTSTGTFSPKTVLFIQSTFVDAYVNSSVVTVMKSQLKYNRVNCSIFDKAGVQVASILVLELNHAISRDDIELLKAVCEHVGGMIDDEGAIRQSRMFGDNMIADLFEGKNVKSLYPDEIDELYSGLKKVLYVVVVDIMHFDPTLTHIAYLCEYLRKLRPEFKYFVHLNNIIILMSFGEIVQNIEKELAGFSEFFKQFNICAGVSGHFSNPMELKKQFRQALDALNYGTTIGGSNNIFSYDIYRIELFVNSHLDRTNVAELCHPLVFQISEYDKIHKTSYVGLIYSYLLHGMCPKLSALDMKISTAELKSLLKKITRIFDIDWKNGNLLFALLRSIRLLKCFSERLNISI